MENKILTDSERITELYDRLERLEYLVLELINKQEKDSGPVWEEF